MVGPPSYADIAPVAKAFVQAAPERMVWGSDWPQPTEKAHAKPEDAILFDLVDVWGAGADDPATANFSASASAAVPQTQRRITHPRRWPPRKSGGCRRHSASSSRAASAGRKARELISWYRCRELDRCRLAALRAAVLFWLRMAS